MTHKEILYSSIEDVKRAGYIGMAFAIYHKGLGNIYGSIEEINEDTVIDVTFVRNLLDQLKGNPLVKDDEVYPIQEMNRLMPYTDLLEPYKEEIMVCYKYALGRIRRANDDN